VRRIFRVRNAVLLLVVLPVILPMGLCFGWMAQFVYRTNYVCGPGEHTLQSNMDAIEVAKDRILQAHYGSYGYFDEKPDSVDFSQTDDCCRVASVRNMYGVIVWTVFLHGETSGETTKRLVSAAMQLSNCGVVFEDSFITAEPEKIETIWPKIK
jgi:hypothetical protein